MHKTEFCLNIYTDGRNTNLKDIMNHTYRFSTQNTVKYISFNTVESGTGPRRSIIFYYTDNADPDEQVAALWFDNVNIGFDWREHGSWVNIWTKWLPYRFLTIFQVVPPSVVFQTVTPPSMPICSLCDVLPEKGDCIPVLPVFITNRLAKSEFVITLVSSIYAVPLSWIPRVCVLSGDRRAVLYVDLIIASAKLV